MWQDDFKNRVFSIEKNEKKEIYDRELKALTAFHRKNCPQYNRLFESNDLEINKITCDNIPFLPVSLFKLMELKSIKEEDIFKVMTSSGTTGAAVSKIYLDTKTSALQQQALSAIVSCFLGENRLPFIVFDTPSVIRDRKLFSARGAGIMGFSIFGKKPVFALNENMELNMEAIEELLGKLEKGTPVFLFGFTFIIWKHIVRELEQRGLKLDIPGGVLIHGGGWKKLINEAVSPTEFKERLRAVTGIERVYSYYGMAEQTGSIYMECEYGHLHASSYSDIRIRDLRDLSICPKGKEGLIQTISLIPGSYPGHSLLTEDLGVLLGEDDCPCGRKGKCFTVSGRIKKAEIRGCSDTYEG